MLGRCDDRPIDPGTQRIILKIVGFLQILALPICSAGPTAIEHAEVLGGVICESTLFCTGGHCFSLLALATYFCPCYQPPQGKTNLKFY